MRILAIDTSGQAASVAVAERGRLLARFWLAHGRTHSEALAPCVEAALGGLGLAPADVGAIAVVVGPGSFTGLRVGVSFAKTMAYALGIQTIAVPSLDALARNVLSQMDLSAQLDSWQRDSCVLLACPMTDARNRQVYAAVFRGIGMPAVLPAAALGIDVLAGRMGEILADGAHGAHGTLGDHGACVVLNGDAAVKYASLMRASLPCPVLLADERDMLPDAASAALLACEMAERGEFTPPELLAPLYLRPSQAERLRAERIKNEC